MKRHLFLLATLALVGVVAVFNSSSTATSATTTVASARPNPGRLMHWFRSHTAARSLERGAARFDSTAVIGLGSMRDLASLRRSYGFETVQAMPALRAARVHVDAAQLHALLAHATGDRRIRYVSPVGPPRHVSNIANDPLVQNVDPRTKLPYEWQFASADLGGALALTAGDPRIQVGVVDTGVDAVPDLAGKIDGLYDVTAHGTQRSASTAGNDDYGHGTAVASLIAANDGDGFGMAGFGGAAHVIGMHADNQGRFYDADLAQAIAKLDALGVRIVNLSIGGPEPSSPILVDAIDKAASDGVLIVAASGNDGWTGRLAGGAPPAQRRRGELRPRGRRDERRRQLCVVLQLRQIPLARRTRDLHGRLLRRARRAAAAEPALGYVLPAVDGLRRHRVRLLRRDLLRVSRGCRCRRARLGRAARVEELPGRRHHQGVRRPRCRRWLDADAGLRPPRRRGGGRARAQPHRCRVGVGCAVGSGLLLRRRRCASRLASHPDDHVHAHSGPDDGGRRLQPERTRVVGPAGHIHDLRRVHSCVTALST